MCDPETYGDMLTVTTWGDGDMGTARVTALVTVIGSIEEPWVTYWNTTNGVMFD